MKARTSPRARKQRKRLKRSGEGKTEEDFRRALALDPADFQAASDLGQLLARLGREHEAAPLLRQAAQHISGPQRATLKELLGRCSRKIASDALAHSQAVFQNVLRDLQQLSPVASPTPGPPPTSTEDTREFIEKIEKVEYVHSRVAGESLIEISRQADGPIRLDLGVIAGTTDSALIPNLNESLLTLHLDSPGTERSRPAFRHSIRLEPGLTLQSVYLPLRKGANRIRISGASVQTIEARSPDFSPSKPPNQLLIPITSYCNFQCVMCPHGLPDGVRDKVHFPESIADLLIADLNDSRQSCDVELTGLGESFMSPGFVRFIEAVKNPLIRFAFTTNGSMLTPERNAWILSSRIWRVNVSLDAGTPETFFKIRRSDWAKVVRNLESLAAAAATSCRPDFLLELNMTLMRENLDDIEPFLRLAARLKAGVYLAYLNDYDVNDTWVVEHDGFVFDYQQQILRSGREVTEKISRARALARELHVPFNMFNSMRPLLDVELSGERIETDSEALATLTPPISHCPSPWAADLEGSAVVHADGSVGMCCLQAPIGNILTDGGLLAVWQGPSARLVRQKMLAGVIPRQCASANCSFVAAQRSWSKHIHPIQKA